ncbi:aspartic peptidase domain-containing protein [Echria macrotheca]|uniref:Aspartic peptidase domain-containing protein n=1 Tax=Echria macrotheca TaxID=438768 RepID=A0AAJ0BGT9_9PEZI|nr:aspartic peptidase domain-containing protein [Echria macrotheca]
MFYTSILLWLHAWFDTARLQSAITGPKFPSLKLEWTSVDSFQGAYFVNIQVGTPPQTIRLVHDSASSDIFLHSTADTAYLASCAAQTPPICSPLYDNTTSTTHKEIGPNKYQPPILGLAAANGSYITETLHIPGATIHSQIMGSTWSASIPVGILGTGFPRTQAGAITGLYPRYPSLITRMVSDGTIAAQTESIWLDPTRSDPDSFPPGQALYGAVDTSLFTGELVTLPAVEPRSSPVRKSDDPTNWNLVLGSVTTSTHPGTNLLANSSSISCVIDTGTAFFALPNSSFVNLVASFPSAVLNSSVQGFPPFWQVPCAEREDPGNALLFTLVDPDDAAINVTVTVPPWLVVWPTHDLVPGGDRDTCALNALAWEAYFGDGDFGRKYECVLGVSVMKAAYWVLDTGRREASVATAVARGHRPGRVVGVPKGGVRKLKL